MTQVEFVQRMDKVDHLHLVPQAKSLLVVEDDLTLVQFLGSVLDEIRPELNWNYVTTGEEALKVIHERAKSQPEFPYDLVIADIFLDGDLTGFDVWLDCQQYYPKMPFIMTSCLTFDRYFSILRGMSTCPMYLPKPLTISRCRAVVDEYF